jgi:arylsulfatase A-like enzyme
MWALRRTSRTYAITEDQSWRFLGRRLAALAESPAFLLLVLAAGGCAAPEPPPQRIILVTIDTLRADHLGAYGYARGVSPFLDDLAGRSVVFEQTFSACSHTAPSHASLFTSLQPAQHRLLVNGEVLDDQLLTIAELLSQQGYRTAAFTPVKFLNGLAAGFDHFDSSEAYEPAETVLARAFEWLEKTGIDTRSFVWIHLYDVHEWIFPKHLHRQSVKWVVDNAELQGGALRRWLGEHHGLPADLSEERVPIVRAVNRYDGQLYAVDQALESFYGKLGAGDLLDGSIWFITSDHGEGLGNHHQMGHGKYIYDEQIRVPLLVHSPTGRLATGRVLDLVRLVDVAPTIAALVGSSMEAQAIPVVGRSILPLLRDRRAQWTVTEAFSQRRPADERRVKKGWLPGDVYATRSDDRKLIINTEGSCEYYDLGTDPFEIDNVCDPSQPDIAELIRRLTAAFDAMQSQGEAMHSGVASPEVIEELKALGYL